MNTLNLAMTLGQTARVEKMAESLGIDLDVFLGLCARMGFEQLSTQVDPDLSSKEWVDVNQSLPPIGVYVMAACHGLIDTSITPDKIINYLPDTPGPSYLTIARRFSFYSDGIPWWWEIGRFYTVTVSKWRILYEHETVSKMAWE